MSTSIVFRRLADAPPPEHELLEVDTNGVASAWRSNGGAVGRFGGPLADGGALLAAAAAVAGVKPPPVPDFPPDASVELLDAAGTRGTFQARLPVADTGPWSDLLNACRAALDAIVASPVAAITGALDPDGTLHLTHAGTAPLPVELAWLQVDLALWRDGRQVAKSAASGIRLGRVDAGPGWSATVKPPAGLDLAGGGILVAQATFAAVDAGTPEPVILTVHRTIP